MLGKGAARTATGDGAQRSSPARQQSVSLLELAREPFVFFDPHVGTGLYDDILGLMRRYGTTPVITRGGRRGNDHHWPCGFGSWGIDPTSLV